MQWKHRVLTTGPSTKSSQTFFRSVFRLPCWFSGKEFTCNAGDAGDIGLIPGSGSSPGEGHGNPLQYSCMENSTVEPGGLQSMGLQRAGHDLTNKQQHTTDYTLVQAKC